jgi:tRNA dimethylallyltransferase
MTTVESLIIVVGPTASGKSALAMQLAARYDGEIICADSRTVYKGMDIGTAKPSTEDRGKIKHHLLDVVEPDQRFNASQFKGLALKAISQIHSRGKLPIMVGGTGLYIDSVLFNYQFGPAADLQKRQMLLDKNVAELQSICRQNNIDIPLNAQNKRHLVRAIELGGLLNHPKEMRKNTIVVGITVDREVLRQHITARAKQMFIEDIVKEAQHLAQKYGWQHESMTGDIYRVVKLLLQGDILQQQAIEQVIKSDMALAKRQLTWFKRNKHIIWSNDVDDLIKATDQFVALQPK